MTNQVNNETEETKGGESSAIEKTPATAAGTEAATAVSVETEQEEKQRPEIAFGAILERCEQDETILPAREWGEGRVAGNSERGILIDFGYKSEAVVPVEEFTTPDGQTTVNVGDTVEVVIRTIHTGDAPPLLSRADALNRKA